ncbi:hypothetical protein [Marinomonas aquiplantarum]|uniref:Oxidoreductase molybdopterin-binding domain-containing protein n=1 Tax=Marinomonas aquiplantarum TaxID=491951 RepID=A0A366D8M7_9GAMM|nr:hypothetical protein [Marinomonas aquiplantarum]RBO86295.1 hypothetical protein DFP76_101572 [Marinomonas aquiplantarum]
MNSVITTLLIFVGLTSLSSFALEQPNQRIILTVEGDFENTNAKQAANFDLPMLAALPQYSVTTKNPWAKGVHSYQGFSAVDLLETLKAKGTMLEVTALNKYMTKVPVEDFQTNGAIFATHRDGVPMSIRNLGPIMVIYPFDQNPELKSEVYYGRSIWQIRHIKIAPLAE